MYNTYGVDFLIQEYGNPNVEVYHGKLYTDFCEKDETHTINCEDKTHTITINCENGYYITGHIVNDLTGDEGVINLKKSGASYASKYDLKVTLKHYDDVKNIEDIRSINKACTMFVIGDYEYQLLVDEHSLLIDAPVNVDKEEPIVSVLIYRDLGKEEGERIRSHLKNSCFPYDDIIENSK